MNVDARAETMRPTYWHGGAALLRPGDLVLPAALTGTWSVYSIAPDMCRRGVVYVTTNERLATWFALERGGRVHEVEPLGPLEVAPVETDSFTCSRARVVSSRMPALTERPAAAMAWYLSIGVPELVALRAAFAGDVDVLPWFAERGRKIRETLLDDEALRSL